MKRFYLSLFMLGVFFLGAAPLAAQVDVLPKGLTEDEERLIADYTFTSSLRTPPPTGPVRAMAEWEEVEYLVITWQPIFPNILRQIVEAAVEECNVIIVTNNESSVSNYLSSNGIDLTNVQFLDVPWDSIWIRDYAGNTVYSDDVGERALVDWIYNRPRPNDDVIPSAHANLLGLPIYITNSGTNDLVNTGGNYMSDGLGNAFASELILEENAPGNPYGVTAKTEEEIDGIMNEYMGIDNYIKMTPLPFDVINHIDMHMKLLDEETLLVSRYPEGVADGPQIEENIDYVLDNFQSAFGTPYRVLRIDAPPSTSGSHPDSDAFYRNYTNALFLNKTILIPTYRPEVDGPALAQWEEMMPGYNIVGIDVDNPDENLISLVGAIHCITHTIGVSDPLWIVHQPVYEAADGETVELTASIKHQSGVADATVFYRQEGEGSFTPLDMDPVGGDLWSADLSIPSNSDDIEYYIQAEANSGKTLNRPIVAPEGYWTMTTDLLSTTEVAEGAISAAYPNPALDRVNFRLGQLPGPVSVSIHDLLGRELFHTTLEVSNGVLELDLRAEWSGMLLISFEGDFGRIHRKVIKR
jgi:agmatine/peptidylarginine deiminase